VWGSRVLVGSVNYQITGLLPFTENPFATIGNDWKLPQKLLTLKQKNKLKEIADAVGNKLYSSGWKGLFGIDVIVDGATGLLYLIEINARQPASTTYESLLQTKEIIKWGKEKTPHVSTFEAHLAALLDTPYAEEELAPITNGAQIVQRITSLEIANNLNKSTIKNKIKELKKLHVNIITYSNTEPGSDLLRLQTEDTLLLSHNQLNKLGAKIQKILS
jgi:hypothetical protein